MTSWKLYIPLIVFSVLATWWIIWPEQYVAVLEAIKKPLRQTSDMRAAVDRFESAFPLSPSKPWYPKFVRICGILIWIVVLIAGYEAYKS